MASKLRIAHLAGAIYEAVLIRHIHGLSLPEAACPLDADAPPVHLIARLFDLRYAISEVASESDVGGFRLVRGCWVTATS